MTGVAWHEWERAPFERAAREGKPILLDISTTWCHWCHVMDDTTYADPEVAAMVNEAFVPVRVDADRRPDVNTRYNMGGWPTTAFLTPEGEIMTGATYLPPGEMKRVLEKVVAFYRAYRNGIAGRVAGRAREEAALEPAAERGTAENATAERGTADRAAAERGTAERGAGGEAAPTPGRRRDEMLEPGAALNAVGEVLDRIEEAYDPHHGGFGIAPKFPQVKALELLLMSYLRNGNPIHLEMVERTLAAMRRGGLYDEVEGGFFRYSTTRDWEVPHYEKLLADNSELLALYSRMARLAGETGAAGEMGKGEAAARFRAGPEAYLDTVRGVAGYLERSLRSASGFFYGSQDADEEYYKLDRTGRRRRDPPRVDRTLFAGWNAVAARGFLEAYLATEDARWREVALTALEEVWRQAVTADGLAAHFVDEAGCRGPVLLGDAADLALACLEAYEVTAEDRFLERATVILRRAVVVFGDPEAGGFYDTPEDREKLGRLRVRHKGLTENARMAVALLRLDTPEGRAQAHRTLALFLGPHRRHGVLAAEYALALEWALGPTPEVTLREARTAADPPAFPTGRALALEAVRAPGGPRLVRYDRGPAHPEAIDRGGRDRAGPDGPAAYVCVGRRCLAPVRDARALGRILREEGKRPQARREEPTGPQEFEFPEATALDLDQ